MIVNQITNSDMIVMQSVDSYLKTLNTPISQNPQERLIIFQKARDYLYSDIVQRVPRVAAYILSADMETDTTAQGLFVGLYNHSLTPEFVDILMQYLSRNNNPEENGVVGALLVKIMNRYIEKNWKDPVKPKKGEKGSEKEETTNNDMSAIKHIQDAVNHLLGNLASTICSHCGNLTHTESLAIAAAISMNNKDTIREIINSDLPVTADIFGVIENPTNIIRSSLLIEKTEFAKTTANQSAFIESLKRWVYQMLNALATLTSYQFLVATYGSIKPDVSKYLIQIKDCSREQYPNLHEVAKQIVNQ